MTKSLNDVHDLATTNGDVTISTIDKRVYS